MKPSEQFKVRAFKQRAIALLGDVPQEVYVVVDGKTIPRLGVLVPNHTNLMFAASVAAVRDRHDVRFFLAQQHLGGKRDTSPFGRLAFTSTRSPSGALPVTWITNPSAVLRPWRWLSTAP